MENLNGHDVIVVLTVIAIIAASIRWYRAELNGENVKAKYPHADALLKIMAKKNIDAADASDLLGISKSNMRDVIIWFEDCTRMPDRAFNETGIASQGMPESDLDKFFQTVPVSVIEKHYVEPGLLSGVRLSYQEKSVSIDFESDLRHLAQELGTNPWIRNAEEPQYLEFWNSGKALF